VATGVSTTSVAAVILAMNARLLDQESLTVADGGQVGNAGKSQMHETYWIWAGNTEVVDDRTREHRSRRVQTDNEITVSLIYNVDPKDQTTSWVFASIAESQVIDAICNPTWQHSLITGSVGRFDIFYDGTEREPLGEQIRIDISFIARLWVATGG
jgi:hypothetical protein